jgi:rsbT co-antagonist protein RsbR
VIEATEELTMSQAELPVSLFARLRSSFGESLAPLRCTKATLVHISHAIEDLVLRDRLPAVLFTGFQESSHWRKETERYRALASVAQQVCIFAGGQLPPESQASEIHVTLRGEDPLRQEWFLVLLSAQFAVVLCGQDRQVDARSEATRQFDTLWSFRPDVVNQVLDMLEAVIADYRPDRLAEIQGARRQFPPGAPDPGIVTQLTGSLIQFEENLHQRLALMSDRLKQQLRWREDLLGTLMHDLRTPLTAISGNLDLMMIDGLINEAERPEILTNMKQAAVRLNDMIQMVLDTNRLEEGQIMLSMEAFETQAWIWHLTTLLEPIVESKGLRFEVDTHPSVRFLWGDRNLLMRVVENLIGNAAKFTPAPGTISLIVAPAASSQSVEIRIRDTGTGISAAHLPHLFDRYYQVQPQERRGYGLGLYFCKLAVDAHEGSIQVVSEVGVSTTFTIRIPARP